MNIDNMTFGELKKIADMFGGANNAITPHVGKKCIVRTYASGVHFGEVLSQSGRQVEIKNARRIWRFDVKSHGISLSEVANHGTTGNRSQVCEVVEQMTILDGLEIIPCTPAAIKVIEAMEVAKPNV